MTIQYASDLHLDFRENKAFLLKHPIQPMGDILILAGDIVTFAGMKYHDDFFDYLSANFKTIYWVPGNHEYYHSDINCKGDSFCDAIRHNLFLVNNTTAMHGDVKFIFSTMWSKISPSNEAYVRMRLNDFHQIGQGDSLLSVFKFNSLHNESLAFIRNELEVGKHTKNVVVTHHVPTYLHYPEQFKGDALNDAFAVELFDMIESMGPEAWIYGHIHHNPPDFKIGKTCLLTNQLGYVRANEHHWYRTDAMVEV
jgi:predicted phosphohydrolase